MLGYVPLLALRVKVDSIERVTNFTVCICGLSPVSAYLSDIYLRRTKGKET
jgi:hypothetical protein